MKTKQGGMTILEVLLAMVIFAAVSMTLISSINGQLSATTAMRDNVFASWVADNVLTTLALANSGEKKDPTRQHVNGWQQLGMDA